MVSPPPLYLALGVGPLKRQAACRASFATEGDPEVLRPLRAFLQAGTPLGNDRIRLQIEQARGQSRLRGPGGNESPRPIRRTTKTKLALCVAKG